jgi:hypothetical protein
LEIRKECLDFILYLFCFVIDLVILRI